MSMKGCCGKSPTDRCGLEPAGVSVTCCIPSGSSDQNWRHLTQESGLIWNDVDEGMLREVADGSLWIGTSSGVSHLLHPERVFDTIPLTISLTEFNRGETNYLGVQQPTMPWGGSPLRFRISSPTMRNL